MAAEPLVLFGVEFSPWAVALTVVALSIVVGWISERIVLRRLEIWARASAWKGDDIILAAVRGLTRIWAILVGLGIAVGIAPISPDWADIVHRILKGVFILTITVAAGRAGSAGVDLYAEHLGHVGRTTIANNLLRAVIFLLGALVLLQTEGISIAPILTALGVGGLAVALAMQDTLSNLFAGVHILVQRQVRPGDFVRLDDGTEGYIVDVGWRNTTIRSLINNLIVIPNGKLAAMVVTNCTLPTADLALVVPISVAYGSDLERIEGIVIEVAQGVLDRTPGSHRDVRPVVRWRNLGDHGVEFNAVLRVSDAESQHLVRSEFVKAIHARFQVEGITIPYPTRVVQLVNPA